MATPARRRRQPPPDGRDDPASRRRSRIEFPGRFDHGEDLITKLVPVSEIPELVRTGQIKHALVVVALYYFDLWQRAQNGK